MKLTSSIEVRELEAILDKCVGDVYIKSIYGDVFNLKSSLARYVAIAELIKNTNSELELFCNKKEDEYLFYEFFNNHPDTI